MRAEYYCENCNGTFMIFRTPGVCPLCGHGASVECSGCGHRASASAFISAGNICPKCKTTVSVAGSSHDFGGPELSANSPPLTSVVSVCIVLALIVGTALRYFHPNFQDLEWSLFGIYWAAAAVVVTGLLIVGVLKKKTKKTNS